VLPAMVVGEIVCLSDDEGGNVQVKLEVKEEVKEEVKDEIKIEEKSSGSRSKILKKPSFNLAEVTGKVGKLLTCVCRCKTKICLRQFRGRASSIVRVRERLACLDKHDADNEACEC